MLTFSFVSGSEDPGKVYESFLARLNYLQDLLCEKDLRKNERFCDMSQELLERLEGLQKVLTSEDRLTCGGKFEWVDSILVKVSTMQEEALKIYFWISLGAKIYI